LCYLEETMKRAAWILGMAAAGAFVGLKSDYPGNIPWGAVIGAAWGGGIGYGFGTIFDTKSLHRPIIAAWTMTLALVGILVGMLAAVVVNPHRAEWQSNAAAVAGACCGALLGYAIGRIQGSRILVAPPP